MNIILFEAEEAASNLVSIEDRRSIHILKILKSSLGDRVRVGIINGKTGVGLIKKISGNKVTLEISLSGCVPKPPLTDLILALPRPIMLKRVLAQSTALGVRKIFLVNARKVEKSFFNSSLLQDGTYREYLIHGLEQSVDTILPTVTIHKRFKPFMEDELTKPADYQNRLIAHPDAKQNL